MGFGFKEEKFVHHIYCAFGGTGDGSSPVNALPIQDQDLLAIEAGMVITDVAVVVLTALTGTTQLDIGDDDDPDGFVSAATLTAAGVTLNDGAYLVNSGQSLGKAYIAAGKEVKMDNTTTNTAGLLCVIIEGYKVRLS